MRIVLAVAAAVATLLLTGCGSAGTPFPSPTVATTATTTQPVFTMNGVFDLIVATTLKAGTACQGTGDYADAVAGDRVSVFSPTGTLLASGQLSIGVIFSADGVTGCKFGITVVGVPDGFLTYGVEIGSHGEQQVDSTTAHNWVFLHA